MNPSAMLLALVAVLPAAALAAWVWLAMAAATEELQSFAGFKGLHFEEL